MGSIFHASSVFGTFLAILAGAYVIGNPSLGLMTETFSLAYWFAYPGGILHSAEIKPGNFSVDEIERSVDELLAASADRERNPE